MARTIANISYAQTICPTPVCDTPELPCALAAIMETGFLDDLGLVGHSRNGPVPRDNNQASETRRAFPHLENFNRCISL